MQVGQVHAAAAVHVLVTLLDAHLLRWSDVGGRRTEGVVVGDEQRHRDVVGGAAVVDGQSAGEREESGGGVGG